MFNIWHLIFILALIGTLCFWVNFMAIVSFDFPSKEQADCSLTLLSKQLATDKMNDSSAMSSNQLATLKMNDSSNATVMGMATGYTVSVYKQFVGSLRNSGYKGNIILVISPNPNPGVKKYLTSKGVTMKQLEIVKCETKIIDILEVKNSHQKEVMTCADPYPNLKVRWGRFPLLRDYLEECETCTGPVLITDVRDTFFQRDPFGDGAPKVTGLQVFEEYKFQRTTHWLAKFPIKQCKNLEMDETMLCSGTTIGTREAMLQYLDIMHKEMTEWMKDPNCCCNKINGDDQSIHNYLYYTGRFPFAQAVKNRMGIVHTVGHQATLIFRAHDAVMARDFQNYTKRMAYDIPLSSGKTWLGPEYDLVDEEGFFLNYDGTRSRVVHQYDRFRNQIKKWLETNGLFDK